jgi:predicted tellurium resistance membrane protein TerC
VNLDVQVPRQAAPARRDQAIPTVQATVTGVPPSAQVPRRSDRDRDVLLMAWTVIVAMSVTLVLSFIVTPLMAAGSVLVTAVVAMLLVVTFPRRS